MLPLPDELYPNAEKRIPKEIDLEKEAVDQSKTLPSYIPDAISVSAKNATISYSAKDELVRYRSQTDPIVLISNKGVEMQAKQITMDMKTSEVKLEGDITAYGRNMILRADAAKYDAKTDTSSFEKLHMKAEGIIMRARYGKQLVDDDGVGFLKLKDIYVTTHDVKEPSFWLGFKEITIYPGDRMSAEGLSVGSGDNFHVVPILGWIPFSHSLNPKEGYLPLPGSRGIWGLYLLNQYGFLLGNRRVENFMPTADYILLTNLDYRQTRGLGYGVSLENPNMMKRFANASGLDLYYTHDLDPNYNPGTIPRIGIQPDRYRVALQYIVDSNPTSQLFNYWRLKTNVNIVSDSQFLSDYFDELSAINDKPDNTVSLVHHRKYSETTLLTRFQPNDYYQTDQRVELSNYQVRRPIFGSSISYESRNNVGIMQQYLPDADREVYEMELSRIMDEEARAFYERVLNEDSYFRVNSVHEVTTSFKLAEIFNVVPKAGVAYNGYYGFRDIEDDSRFSAYFATDVSMKMQRSFDSVRSRYFKIDGVRHIFQPYASYSYHNISSTNPYVPHVDAWVDTLGSSTSTPIPLDLNGFSGMDAWSDWNILRFGFQNYLTTRYDGETRRLLRWNIFLNVNLDAEENFFEHSTLYSMLKFTPSERLSFVSDIQLPLLSSEYEYRSLSHGVSYQATRWMELQFNHTYLYAASEALKYKNKQFNWRLNLRLNEHYSFSSNMYWDMDLETIPLQQYSIFRNMGAWQMGGTVFIRDNGGVKETGVGFSFSLIQTNSSVPVNFF